MGAWGMLESHGLLPYPGALLDQHPKFLAACEVASGERARIEVELTPSPSGGQTYVTDIPAGAMRPEPKPARRGGVSPEDGALRGGFRAPGEG